MSKVVITGNASGTGDFTIAAPNSNTDRTLTLPDEAGTVLTSASSLAAANLTGSLPAISGAALTGVGKVLQVLNTGWTSTSATSVNGTPIKLMSLSITIQANSKVLVFMATGQTDNNGADKNPLCYLAVDGVQFSSNTNHWFYGVDLRVAISMQALSGVLTSGVHTVDMFGGSYNGPVSYNYQASNQGSLIVLEIGA